MWYITSVASSQKVPCGTELYVDVNNSPMNRSKIFQLWRQTLRGIGSLEFHLERGYTRAYFIRQIVQLLKNVSLIKMVNKFRLVQNPTMLV